MRLCSDVAEGETMRTWTKTAGIIFLAVASVYSNRAIAATDTTTATPAKPVTPIVTEEASTDPFASATATTRPTEGQSVTASQVNVTDAGTVEIHVNDANLIEVLRMMSLQTQKNITASKEVRGTIT